jgi:hypothetical protein
LTEVPRQGGKVTSMVERLTEENQRLHQAFWGMAEQLDNWARQNQVKADDLHGNVSRHQYSALATEQRNYASWIRRILRGKG